MIHPVLDQAALHHQAVQVVLTALPTNQKITMESLVKVCLHSFIHQIVRQKLDNVTYFHEISNHLLAKMKISDIV